MRVVMQRVLNASLSIDGAVVSEIGKGLVCYVGIGQNDDAQTYAYVCEKLIHTRIFEDEDGKMNRSAQDIGGELLIVSNFTLYGDLRHGRRPSYSGGAPVEVAREKYAAFCEQAKEMHLPAKFGVFQADMKIDAVCDGPVNLLLDSDKLF